MSKVFNGNGVKWIWIWNTFIQLLLWAKLCLIIWLIFNNIKTGYKHFINMNYHNSSINTLYNYNTFTKYTNMAGSIYSLYIQNSYFNETLSLS